MKILYVLLLCSLVISCSSSVKINISELPEIYPSAKCPLFESANIQDDLLDKVEVKCIEGKIETVIVRSKIKKDSKHSLQYLEVEEGLKRLFKDNALIYREGEKIIDFDNGIELQVISDNEKGIIIGFNIILNNNEKIDNAWKKALESIK